VLAKKWKEVQYKAVKELDICVFLAFEPSNQVSKENGLYKMNTQYSA
jgi:hypothetical protein